MRHRGRVFMMSAAGVLSLTAALSQARTVTASLPVNAGAPPGSAIIIPLELSSAAGVLGTDIIIRFDPAVVTVQGVGKTTLSASHTLTTNLTAPGVLRISLFGATALSGGGALLNITMQSAGATGGSTPLQFDMLQLNEGQIPATATDGRYCVQGRPDEVSDLEVIQPVQDSPEILMTWRPVTFARGYNVYRGGSAGLSDLICSLPLVGPAWTMDDGSVPAPGGLLVFLVTSVNCSDESSPGFSSAGLERSIPVPCP